MTVTRPVGDAVLVGATAELTLVLTSPGLLAAFSPALDPLWTIAVEPPDLGYTARITDNRLAVVAAAVTGRRAYLRGREQLTTVEW